MIDRHPAAGVAFREIPSVSRSDSDWRGLCERTESREIEYVLTGDAGHGFVTATNLATFA